MSQSPGEPVAPQPSLRAVEFPTYISNVLESYVTGLLEQAGIPSFIWGEPYLSILGSMTASFYSGYIVPDEDIDKAAEVLDKAAFPPCIHGKEKCLVFSKYAWHPYPDYHWHTDLVYTELPKWPGDLPSIGVRLYKQSRIFWTFPKPCLGPPPKDDPYYMLVTDPRINTRPGGLAAGRQPEGLYPVKMAVPARYMEAIMLCRLRDKRKSPVADHWDVELNYLAGDEIFGFNLQLNDLNEPFREWAKRMSNDNYAEKVANDFTGARYEVELFLDMKRRNQLPPPERRRWNYPQEESFKEYLERFNVPYEESDLVYG
ncbi:hypothetical protein BDV18DRAFT_65847 [Aspergillus unguis]